MIEELKTMRAKAQHEMAKADAVIRAAAKLDEFFTDMREAGFESTGRISYPISGALFAVDMVFRIGPVPVPATPPAPPPPPPPIEVPDRAPPPPPPPASSPVLEPDNPSPKKAPREAGTARRASGAKRASLVAAKLDLELAEAVCKFGLKKACKELGLDHAAELVRWQEICPGGLNTLRDQEQLLKRLRAQVEALS